MSWALTGKPTADVPDRTDGSDAAQPGDRPSVLQREDRRLLDDGSLATSSVIANCAMNRERQLAGVNSYAKELGFNPLDALLTRLAEQDRAGWLDLCCGTGRARSWMPRP
ncbi:MAG: hypothetical protein J2P15_15085 [Micromonosporaceae bacterium]|nr:hypothetical protein [Micromonosporaceae bacterium]